MGSYSFSLLRYDTATPSPFLMKYHFYVSLLFLSYGHLVNTGADGSALQRVTPTL